MMLQTEDDRRNQREIASAMAQAFGVDILHHNDPYAPIDTYVKKGSDILGYIEIKGRTHDREKYKTVYVSVRKWANLNLYAKKLHGIPLFAARFADGSIGWVDVRRVGGRARWLGRYDRGLNNDREPMLEVPVEMFGIVGVDPSPFSTRPSRDRSAA